MYESPIQLIINEAVKRLEEEQEKYVMEYIQNMTIDVDKEELIRALQYDRKQYEHGYRDGLKANKWIPISDRLPDLSRPVLVYDGYFLFVAWYVGKGEWHSNDLCCDPFHTPILAWMPLPEPYIPEGGGEEDEE